MTQKSVESESFCPCPDALYGSNESNELAWVFCVPSFIDHYTCECTCTYENLHDVGLFRNYSAIKNFTNYSTKRPVIKERSAMNTLLNQICYVSRRVISELFM